MISAKGQAMNKILAKIKFRLINIINTIIILIKSTTIFKNSDTTSENAFVSFSILFISSPFAFN